MNVKIKIPLFDPIQSIKTPPKISNGMRQIEAIVIQSPYLTSSILKLSISYYFKRGLAPCDKILPIEVKIVNISKIHF